MELSRTLLVTAAAELEAEADLLGSMVVRLQKLADKQDLTKTSFSDEWPAEFRIDPRPCFASSERVFKRYIDLYKSLEGDWHSLDYYYVRRDEYNYPMDKSSRVTMPYLWFCQDNQHLLNKCATIARDGRGFIPRTEVPEIHYHTYHGEVRMGDVFQGISNSTIVSRSKVEGAFNRLQDSGQGESAKLLVKIGKSVSDANNAAAGAVYSQMAEELSKPVHDKGVLKSCWNGLIAILPPLATLSAEVIKAFAI